MSIGAGSLPTETTVLTDVNILAIGLTDDHPAHDDVYPWIEEALDGPNVLLVFDYYPLRAQYIMTQQFGVEPVEARNAAQSLVQSPARIISATDTTLLDAYDISAEKATTCTKRFFSRSHARPTLTACSPLILTSMNSTRQEMCRIRTRCQQKNATF
jgi:hypothetical protein